MKKRLKTDGVEGLLEIVKAVQNGEDPEEMLKRKEAERLMAEMEAERIAAEKEAAERAARKEAAERAAREAEEKKAAKEAKRKARLEEQPDSEAEEAPKGKRMMGKVFEGLTSLAGVLGGKKDPSARKKEESKVPEEDKGAEAAWTSKRAEEAAGMSENEAADGRAAEEEQTESDRSPEEVPAESDRSPEEVPTESDGAPTEAGLEEKRAGLAEEQKEDHPDAEAEEVKVPREKTEDELILDRLLERNGISPDEVEDDEDFDPKVSARIVPRGKLAESEKEEDPEMNSAKAGIHLGGVRDYVLDLIDNLKQRGISKKESALILAGVILAVLVIVLACNGLGSLLNQRGKSENVTADKGLTVTVEDEPAEWCTSYPVQLKFKVAGENIKQVSVNGVNYLPDETGMITVETGEWLLDTVVTTETAMYGARVEIPRLDSQDPAVNIQREQNMITLTAADVRSEVKGIYYAAVSVHTPWELPGYQEYKEPIAYEADTLYYFYAEDNAGNRSVPTKTTMETAQSMAPSATELSLFPGETRALYLVTTPENAYVNELRFESTDEAVARVDSAGNVTAVAEGVATVKISAKGLNDDAIATMACTVTVSKSRSVTISAIGDCTLGTDEAFNTMTNFNAFDTVNGHSYFFKYVREILANDDATFANLEGTFTTETTREIKEYAFKGDPSYTAILQDGSIEVVTLANNHSSDYGEKSLEDTKGYLTEAEIDYCIGDTIAMKEINGIKTAFIGIYVLKDGMEREMQVRETIAQAKNQGAQLVIVGFHWGSEKATQPDETQTSLAHIAVDAGANLVVGHHPHVLQGIEKYNGVYIVYSLGNFCFGGNSTPSDMDTMIFRQTFTITEGTVEEDDQIEVIPCSISSTTGYNNYQPTPANGTEAERIIGRINEYSAAYGQTFTASTGL